MGRIATTTVAALAAAVLLAGCAGDGEDSATAEEEAAEFDTAGDDGDEEVALDDRADDGDAGEADEPVTSVAQVDPAPRHIVYTVDVAIETDDVVRAAARAVALAEAAGGFVAHEDMHGTEQATLTLRVPSARHLSLVAQLEEFGEVRDRSRTAEDVTAEVVDLEARVASQRRSIERIRELLDAASDLSDVVRIESELARREADLESLLQRQERLSSLTSLATVTVTFVGTGSASANEQEPLGFLSGLSSGWSAFVVSVRIAATVIGALLPFAVTVAVIGIPAWLLWRRSRPTRSAPQPAAAASGPGSAGGDQG